MMKPLVVSRPPKKAKPPRVKRGQASHVDGSEISELPYGEAHSIDQDPKLPDEKKQKQGSLVNIEEEEKGLNNMVPSLKSTGKQKNKPQEEIQQQMLEVPRMSTMRRANLDTILEQSEDSIKVKKGKAKAIEE